MRTHPSFLLIPLICSLFGQEAEMADLSEQREIRGTNDVVIRKGITTDVAELQVRNPFLRLATNSEGQVLLDYQYVSSNAPVAIHPEINIHDAGATARNGQHTVEFDGNLNGEDSIVIQMPGNRIFRGRPAALSISDGTGKRTWIGEIQDSQGEISGEQPNQVIYRDAFTGIKADVIYTYELNSFEQDIILREHPLLPADFDENTAKIEVWTEFFQVPNNTKATKQVVLRKPIDGRPSVVADDEWVDFGPMQIISGQAFHTSARRAGEKVAPEAQVPVAKEWIAEGEQTFLVERSDYLSLKPLLETLPKGQANAGAATSVTNLARLAPKEKPRLKAGERTRLLTAIATVPERTIALGASAEPGVVIDYIIVNTALLNINFGGAYAGSAAVGKSTTDVWNQHQTCNTHNGSLNNLVWSSGAASGINLITENAPGCWGNTTGNSMIDSYIYPGNGGNVLVRLDNIPTGTYDFYIYGGWSPGGSGAIHGRYVLSSGATVFGQKQTVQSPYWASLNWAENEHYVRYANVTVSSGHQVVITALPGSNVALINGIQMVASGSVNTPPTISDIPNQTTSSGVAVGPVNFTIGDTQTPSGSLNISVASGNTSLVPNGNISIGGSGSSRNITVIPAAGQTGNATITVTVSDGSAQVTDNFTVTVSSTPPHLEINKAVMTADASSFWQNDPWFGFNWTAARAIDGQWSSDPGWHSGPNSQYSNNEWVRINLNTTGYNISRVQYYPRVGVGNGSFLQYRVFVTSSSSTDPAQWGAAVAQGTWSWPSGAEVKTLTLATPKQGQYVIFQCLSGVGGWAAAGEVWIYHSGGSYTDSDNDGLPDFWEMQWFGNLNQKGFGDWDGDGITNLQEYQQGGNPTSHLGLQVFTLLK